MCRAIASLAVTLPSVYYLMQPQIERFQHPEKHGHGGHGGHGEHGEHGEEGEGGEQSDSSEGEESEEGKSEDQGEGGETDEGNPDDSGSEDGEKDTPGTSEDEDSKNTIHEKEGGQDVEGVQFKGATREGEQGDTRKHIPDAKGFSKKRIESDYGGKEGEAQKPEQDPSNEDMVSIAPYVEPLRIAILLTLGIRLLHPNLRETRPHNRESKKDSQTLIPSTPSILPTTLKRALKVRAARRQQKTKEQWILKDHRSETLDDTSFRRLRAVFAGQSS